MENTEAVLIFAAKYGTVPALMVIAVLSYRLRRAFGKTHNEALIETLDEMENKND